MRQQRRLSVCLAVLCQCDDILAIFCGANNYDLNLSIININLYLNSNSQSLTLLNCITNYMTYSSPSRWFFLFCNISFLPLHSHALQFAAMKALSDLFSHCAAAAAATISMTTYYIRQSISFDLDLLCDAVYTRTLIHSLFTSFNLTNQRELELKKITDGKKWALLMAKKRKKETVRCEFCCVSVFKLNAVIHSTEAHSLRTISTQWDVSHFWMLSLMRLLCHNKWHLDFIYTFK